MAKVCQSSEYTNNLSVLFVNIFYRNISKANHENSAEAIVNHYLELFSKIMINFEEYTELRALLTFAFIKFYLVNYMQL